MDFSEEVIEGDAGDHVVAEDLVKAFEVLDGAFGGLGVDGIAAEADGGDGLFLAEGEGVIEVDGEEVGEVERNNYFVWGLF